MFCQCRQTNAVLLRYPRYISSIKHKAIARHKTTSINTTNPIRVYTANRSISTYIVNTKIKCTMEITKTAKLLASENDKVVLKIG